MTNKALCLDSITDKLYENLIYAKSQEYIRKPYSWALYQTWKLINAVEHERKADRGENDAVIN